MRSKNANTIQAEKQFKITREWHGKRQITYENDSFMCQLPSDVDVGNRSYDDEDDRSY